MKLMSDIWKYRERFAILAIALMISGIIVYNTTMPDGANYEFFAGYYIDMMDGEIVLAPYGFRIMGPILASMFDDHILGGRILIAVTFAIGGFLMAWIVRLVGCGRREMWLAMILFVCWHETTGQAALTFAIPDGLGMLFLLLAIALTLKRWDGFAIIVMMIGITAKATPLAAIPLWFIVRWQTDRLTAVLFPAILLTWFVVFRYGLCDIAESTIPITHSYGLWQDFWGVMEYKRQWDWFSWTYCFAPLSILLPLFVLGLNNIRRSLLTLFIFPILALFLATTIGRMMAMAAPILILGACVGLQRLSISSLCARNAVYWGIAVLHIMNCRHPVVMVGLFLLPVLLLKGSHDD